MQYRPDTSPLERAIARMPEQEKALTRIAALGVRDRSREVRKTTVEEVWNLWLEFLKARKASEQNDEAKARVNALASQLKEYHAALSEEEKILLRTRVMDIEKEDRELYHDAGKSIQTYHQTLQEKAILRAEIARIDAERFAKNGAMDGDELAATEEADIRAVLKQVTEELAEMERPALLTTESSALATYIAAERVKRYAKELHEHGFAVMPSRERYMDEITQTLLTSRRPIFLSGVSGGGKTAMIRAIARQLTGREPFEASEAAKKDIRMVYGTRSLTSTNQEYYIFGALMQALTGKKTSLPSEPAGRGGMFYLDEANGFQADDLRDLIKLLSGKKPGETFQCTALNGLEVTVAPGFRFVMAGNLKSAKHTDRTELPPEVDREVEVVDIPAMSQHETYQIMLAELMDEHERIRLPGSDCAPFRTISQNTNGTYTFSIDESENRGGTVWRFSKLVSAIQAAFANEDPSKDRLFIATFDVGKLLSWVKDYRRNAQRQGQSLGDFLKTSFKKWANKSTYSEEDKATLQKLFLAINGEQLDMFGADDVLLAKAPEKNRLLMKPGNEPMSTRDLGRIATESTLFVAPNTQKSPEPVAHIAIRKDGTEIHYAQTPFKHLEIGKIYDIATFSGKFVYQGIENNPQGSLVFLSQEHQFALTLSQDSTHAITPAPEPIPPKGKERPLGVAEKEMKDLLGKYYFGSEAAETTCSIDNGKKKLFPLSVAEKQQASEQLRAKLAEPDVRQFVERLKKDPTEKEKWMLVYVPQKSLPEPLSLRFLAQELDKDLKPSVNLVYDAENRSKSTGFFGKNTFATEQIPSGWHFVSKTVLSGTTSKNQTEQAGELQKEATRLGFTPGTWKRTHPALRFFALISNYKNNNAERLMSSYIYDRSDVKTASGYWAGVGHFGADGLDVHESDDDAVPILVPPSPADISV